MKTIKEYVCENYSPKSAMGYVGMIKRYLGYVGETSITASYTDVLNYIAYLRKKGLHPRSLAHHLFTVKIYYHYLLSVGLRQDHPCRNMLLKDRINKRIPVENLYSKSALEELLINHKSKEELFQRRDEILIGLLIYQAMNVQEIVALNIEDINLKEATIKASGGYRQKSRSLSLRANQILLLHEYLSSDREKIQKDRNINSDDKRALLVEDSGKRLPHNFINKVINENREKNKKLLPMKIRQSVILHLLKEKHNLRIVQVFSGHRRSGSTEQYKQTSLEDLKEVIQNLHPLEVRSGAPTGN